MAKFVISEWGKICILMGILLALVIIFSKCIKKKEGFTQQNEFLFKTGDDIYDDFYTSIYDQLVFNPIKNSYEVGEIINNTNPSSKSKILDVGCGTGHHVAELSTHNLEIIGIDISPSMIKQAKRAYPKNNFIVGNVMTETRFSYESFTDILCLYFTIYYLDNKRLFFENCMSWLMPGGYLYLHLVDRDKFDPILPPGNPLYIVSPQKYAKDRIMDTKVVFDDFVYTSKFNLVENEDRASFDEKFKFNDGKIRKHQHVMYMENTETIVAMAQQCGFVIHKILNLVQCAYEHQYVYVLVKP